LSGHDSSFAEESEVRINSGMEIIAECLEMDAFGNRTGATRREWRPVPSTVRERKLNFDLRMGSVVQQYGNGTTG